MKHLIFFLIFVFNIQFVLSQETHTEPYYIWAKSGLSLREAPNTNAEKLTTIPYSGKVSFISYAYDYKTFTVTEFRGFQYTAYWAKVSYNNQIGYAFSGYLSLIKPPKINKRYSITEYLNNSFTKLIVNLKTVKTKMI